MDFKSNSEKVAETALNQFNALPKTGKPKNDQWTIMSCIVQEKNSCYEVVSLGTGSKCIGRKKACPRGTIVNDSHSEIMCRRGFVVYLYNQLNKESKIFSFDEQKVKFSLKPDVKFHFFTTHVPCGDAAIFPKADSENYGDIVNEELPRKKLKLDINRTGAKCLTNDAKQDPKVKGSDYHIKGCVRTKPGRGDPTASVSCSDKLAKWCHIGIQGALLMLFLERPIYLTSFVTSTEIPFCQVALERALYKRLEGIQLIKPFSQNVMEIQRVNCKFDFKKDPEKIPCSSSIVWYQTYNDKILEIGVNGRKQGVTKKHILSEKGRLKICKLEIFKTFIEKAINFQIKEVEPNIPYAKAKSLSKNYQENWEILKRKFGIWTSKDPELLNFTCAL